jgi:hypothetical protein
MTWIVLSNNTMVQVPEGADPDRFRQYEEAKLNYKPKRKRRSSTRCHRSRRHPSASTVFAQQQARALVMAELVERVNERTAK